MRLSDCDFDLFALDRLREEQALEVRRVNELVLRTARLPRVAFAGDLGWGIRISTSGCAYLTLGHESGESEGTWFRLGCDDMPVDPGEWLDLEQVTFAYEIREYGRRTLSDFWKAAHRFLQASRHKLVCSPRVSMGGRLHCLVPAYVIEVLIAKIRKQAIHFESVTLSEERERLSRFGSIQTLRAAAVRVYATLGLGTVDRHFVRYFGAPNPIVPAPVVGALPTP